MKTENRYCIDEVLIHLKAYLPESDIKKQIIKDLLAMEERRKVESRPDRC